MDKNPTSYEQFSPMIEKATYKA